MPSKPRMMTTEADEAAAGGGGGGSSSSFAGTAGSSTGTGSLPVQMPGRSYYKYRSVSTQARSVTQNHLDIREGSARLASLGLAEFGDESYPDEDEPETASTGLNAYDGEENDTHEGLLLSSTKQPTPVLSEQNTPSGLSVLLSKHEERRARAASAEQQSPQGQLKPSTSSSSGAAGSSGSDTVGEATPTARSPNKSTSTIHPPATSVPESAIEDGVAEDLHPSLHLPTDSMSERSPLLRAKKVPRSESLSKRRTSYTSFCNGAQLSPYDNGETDKRMWSTYMAAKKDSLVASSKRALQAVKKTNSSVLVRNILVEPVKTLPAVILGILMNLLDGVSYGMIMFPVSSPVFSSFGGIGVSMFFSSCFVSQMVFGAKSIFKGGNGSMMIEVVPFLHVIAFTISDRMGGMENQHAVIATTMVAYALTALLTGLVFFLLGYLRLGAFIEFFPRVVLVGCIGGVGAFLVITGVQVCAGLENETLHFTWDVIKRFFEMHLFVLWFTPLILAIVIRIITSSRFDHPLVFPAFMLAIPIVFYIVVFAARIPMSTLREQGWIFDMNGVDTPFYEYFTLYDFGATDVAALLETVPTQLALVFFALLHVPINVPALALSVGEDNVETDKELVAHGLSNFLAGCVGSIPNYLVYTNSVLFYRVGGTSRLASFMLAAVTLLVFLIGPWVIGYLPVMIVGTLIYVLGYDLLKEAVWDTWGRVSGFDYFTIWIIVAAMTYFDFVVGIGVGIVVACISFVIVSSQRQPIRAMMSGATASSTVRRHPRQSAFLRKVGTQTRIIKLQSFLFFGTVVKVEAKIREILDAANWTLTPIRFLILDFTLASGVDFSAAEAFLRIQRLLQAKNVILVLCGCGPETAVGKALDNVDLFGHDEAQVRLFASVNDALEHCENSQLRSLYSKTLDPNIVPQQDATRVGVDTSYRLLAAETPASALDSFSPRRTHLFRAATEAFSHGRRQSINSTTESGSAPSTPSRPTALPSGQNTQKSEPLKLLVQSLGPYAPELKEDFFGRLVPYFVKLKIAKGDVLWNIGDPADAMYVLETGILRATYEFPDTARTVSESMLPGTVAGEMTFLAASKRNATVVAERDCQLWRLNSMAMASFEEKEGVKVARAFRQIALRISAESTDVLVGYLMSG